MKVASPNPAAFENFYRTQYHAVLLFLARRASMSEAEDVAHEAFIIAWRKAAEIPADPGEARAWICAIARNCLLNYRRGIARDQARMLRAAETAPTTIIGPEDVVVGTIDLNIAWQKLRPADQEVIALTAWDDLTAAQAAQVLGITAFAYRTRLSRARKALRAAIEDSAEVKLVNAPPAKLPIKAPANSSRQYLHARAAVSPAREFPNSFPTIAMEA
jgi:RNA polymerase sigma-70 factor, ECF subfamily